MKTNKKDGINIFYSELRQHSKPYNSTIAFEKFLFRNKVLSVKKSQCILDVGTGIGSNLRYFSTKYN